MIRASVLPAIAGLCCVSAIASPDPVEDVRTGAGLHFDLRYMTYTYTGAMSGNGEVLDKDAPPGCAPKDPGTLDFTLDTGALGLPFSVQIPVAGTRLSATRVRWTFDSIINQCVTIEVNGEPVQVLIRRVWGRFTADAEEIAATWDEVCQSSRNVRLDDWGGNAENWINAEAYAFCVQSAFTRINFEGRNIDAVMFGGVGRLLPQTFGLLRGIHISGGVEDLHYSDDMRMVFRPGLVLSTSEAPIQLVLNGQSPNPEPEEIRFTLEARASTSNIRQRIELFDFDANAYVLADERPATTADSVVEVSISANPARFVNATGAVRTRVSYRATGPVLAFPWTAQLDQAVWLVTP